MNNSQKNIKHRRQELIKLLGAGYPIDDIAIKLKCSIQTIYDDKKFIAIEGFKQLKEIGPEQLLFYYQTIESSIRYKKGIIASILKMGYTKGKVTSKIPLDILLKTIKQDSELDTQLKELYKDITTIITKDYKNRIRLISIGLSKARDGQSLDTIDEFKQLDIITNEDINLESVKNNPYMDLDLPHKDNTDNDSIPQ